jgi:uncharacterized protein (DUF58 family)
MLIPSRRLLILAALWLLLGIAASVWAGLIAVWLTLGGVLAFVAGFDLYVCWRRPLPQAQRLVAGSLALGVRAPVKLRFTATPGRAAQLEVFDHHPPQASADGMPARVVVRGGEWTEGSYWLTPLQRGDLQFGHVVVRVDSPWRLWQRRAKLGQPEMVRVYPNFAAVTKYTLLATDHRLSQIGVLQRRRRGEGMEFDSLREYRQGDSLRRIDWKATARADKMIARDYRDERDQQVMFLLDCSRRMNAKDDALTHFDHAMNATLLLAYVALAQGDAVGLATFGGEVRRVAPRKSGGTLNQLLNTVYDLQPSLAVPDYYSAAVDLLQRVRKRALVVILSNLRDEDDSTLLPAIKLLTDRHLVLFANLREMVVDAVAAEPVRGLSSALTYAAAVDYLARRRRAFQRLSHCGAIAMDVTPDKLALAMVNQYLGLKSSGQL